MLCYIKYVTLYLSCCYITCHVMLYNICHAMLCYICYVMLYNKICSVMTSKLYFISMQYTNKETCTEKKRKKTDPF